MGDGYLQFGVVILSFAVEVDPDAGHGKGMSRLWLVNVRNWDALRREKTYADKGKDHTTTSTTILLPIKAFDSTIQLLKQSYKLYNSI